MLPLLRRFLVLAALFFWQGGFTFYGAVVIPAGFHVFRSHREQARITVEVARFLNLAGIVALPLFLWDVVALTDPIRRRRQLRLLVWCLLALTQGSLLILYPVLAGDFDVATRTIHDEHGFRIKHKIYLWISTGQLAAVLVFLWLSLRSWQAKDAQGLG